MNSKLAVLILFLAGAARAETPGSARVETLIRSLNDAGMPRSVLVLLAALATDAGQPDEVRSAAGAMLAARSGSDPAAIVPAKVQVTCCPAAEHDHPDPDDDWNVRPLGRVSTTLAPEAAAVPTLDTVMV